VLALPDDVRAALDAFRGLLRARFGARLCELTLFGSYARGEATEDSDVDVLVVIEGLTMAERRAALDLAYDAQEPARYVALAPLVFSTSEAADRRGRERLIMADIAADGVPL
jgi:predicted nucleotidyltransferase